MGLFGAVRGITRFLFHRIVELTVIAVIVIFLPKLPPYCKFETPYKVTPALPLEGKLAYNEKLSGTELWHNYTIHGPESFATHNGKLYASLQNGEVVEVYENQFIYVVSFGKSHCETIDEVNCGRPLGLAFNKAGDLFVADAYKGIFKVDTIVGNYVNVVSPDVEINGKKPKLFNSIVIASNGDIYWTDSSTEFTLQDGVFDLLADGSGRVIKYDAVTKRNTVLLDNLHFPNGLLLSENEDFLVISVTGRSLLLKYHLKGKKAGQHEILIDGLPGAPDNIKSDGRGGILVPLVMAHDAEHPNPIQIFGPFPLLRKLFARLYALFGLSFQIMDYIYPSEFAKLGVLMVGHFAVPIKYVNLYQRTTIIHLSESGEILNSWHTMNGEILAISEAFIYEDDLLLGSPFNTFIGRIPLKELGLKPLPVQATPKPTATPTKAPTTQAPTTTTTTTPPTKPSTTAAPKVTTTQAPKTTTQPPKPSTTQPPKPSTTQAPKTTTTQAPKTTQATKTTTQAPKTTQPPTKTSTQAPKATNKPEQKRDVPVQSATKPPVKPTEAPKVVKDSKTEPPKKAEQPTKQSTPPKATNTPPPTQKPAATQPPKVDAKKDAAKTEAPSHKHKNEL